MKSGVSVIDRYGNQRCCEMTLTHAKTRHASANAAGFSLLEAIVTLVIIAMIVTLLTQSLAHGLGLRERVLMHQSIARINLLQQRWFRDSVESAIADMPEALGGFVGSDKQMELVSAAPLDGSGLARIRWYLEPTAKAGASRLRYSDETLSELPVVDSGLRDASFSYLDKEGHWLDHWPNNDRPEDVLPELVRLEARTDSGKLVWLVAVMADAELPNALRPEDVFNAL